MMIHSNAYKIKLVST